MRVILVAIAAMFTVATGLSSVALAGDAANGEKLFNDKAKGQCSVCHNTSGKKKVGPGLAGVSSRFSDGWLVKWLMDPQGVWEANDAETQKMKESVKKTKKKKTAMKLKNKLSQQQAEDIVAYMKGL